MQYVLEAHRQFIRSKLSSNQNQNLNMIVKYKNTLLPVVPSVHLFTSTLNQSRKKKHLFFLVAPSPFIQLLSLSMFRQLLNTFHMRNQAFWAKLKPLKTTQETSGQSAAE